LEILIVTGMSGAGKSEALKCLEDLGYNAIDNLPAALLPNIASLAQSGGQKFERVAIGMDIRGGTSFEELFDALGTLEEKGFKTAILFLDASDEVLVRRFSQTRRIHPLNGAGLRVADTIAEERRLLEELHELAGIVIDTSDLNIYELRDKLAAVVPGASGAAGINVTVVSFGYRYGIPLDTDMVMDVRFLPNPYWVQDLRGLSGLDDPVAGYVLDRPETKRFIADFVGMVEALAPSYEAEHKSHLSIGIGCTGGRHRSVAIAEEIAARLDKAGFPVRLVHRDIDRQ